MAADAFARLDATRRVVKRAQYEAFSFSVAGSGVLVRNESHADPENHEYLVDVEDGVPVACECPADERFDGACKHRVAVAIRRPVLDAATAQARRRGRVVTDGGPASGQPELPKPVDDHDCDCERLPGEFPCWECVRTGRRELPGTAQS